jgi:hypothetical protein
MQEAPQPMLRVCPEPGCTTFTLGGRCVAHDHAPRPPFVRGKPFPATGALDPVGQEQPPALAGAVVA